MVGKGRPRITTQGGFARAFTPSKTVNAEAHIRACALRDVGHIVLEGPLAVEMVIAVSIPESWSKKKKAAAAAGMVRPTGRPDADNCLKMLDALNGICWKDDAQIVDARVVKNYGFTPMTVIRIRDAVTLITEQARAA